MSLDTEGSSAETSESVSSESSSESNSGYSVVDPGYDSGVPSESTNELADLKAENTKTETPSEQSDDAGGDTEETAEKPSAESADNDFSDELLDRATELGYTLDDIKGFRSEKSLAKEVSRVERLQQRMQERQTGKPPVEQEADQPEEEPEPDWAELLEAGHDPDVVGMQQKMWQRATRAEAMVKQVFQADQDRAWSAQCERFDDSLNKLGDEFKSILGTGRRGELLKSSPDMAANRDKVFEKLLVLKNGYQQSGTSMPSEADLIQEAVQASFWKQTKTLARQELTGQIKKAGSQALSRPRSAGSKSLSGQALATSKEQDFWKNHS